MRPRLAAPSVGSQDWTGRGACDVGGTSPADTSPCTVTNRLRNVACIPTRRGRIVPHNRHTPHAAAEQCERSARDEPQCRQPCTHVQQLVVARFAFDRSIVSLSRHTSCVQRGLRLDRSPLYVLAHASARHDHQTPPQVTSERKQPCPRTSSRHAPSPPQTTAS